MDYKVILMDFYVVLVAIFILAITVDWFFCTSKNVFISPEGKCYERRQSEDGVRFWRPCKRFIFKNTFRYILEDDKITVPDLIPYKEWLKQSGK